MHRLTISVLHLCLSAFICGSILSCDRPAADTKTVVLYTSIDEPIARPIIEAFEKSHGVKVTLVTDTEANKSVGLAEKLRAEKDRPRADVWWGNEPFHTINLAEEGLFAPYESPSAADVPAMFRDPKHRWAGNGLRARVFIVHAWESTLPRNLEQLNRKLDAMARPSVGTTAGHVAAIYVVWGQERADEFFRKLRADGIVLLGGNGPVAEAVARGDFSLGLTDNDDVENVRKNNDKMSMVTARINDENFVIPTTVALVADRPDSPAARKLIDYLLSKEVEQNLIDAKFAVGWSIREEHRRDADATSGQPNSSARPKAMQIDYTEVAKKMPEAVRRATAILEGREP